MPTNYSDEAEQKAQQFKRAGVRMPPKAIIRSDEQIAGIRESGKINTALLDYLSEHVRAGISTDELNTLAHEFTVAHGATPATLGFEGYPKSLCISINNVVCHGIPSPTEILRDGDIVNLDVTTIFNGYYADASRMFLIGNVLPAWQHLVDVARECLMLGIKAAQPWGRIGDIGAVVQQHAEAAGYSVVRELCGHGVGVDFHEIPNVEHFGRRGTGMLIVPGMTFTIEPMINMGTSRVTFDRVDGWTVRTADGMPSAQWEHTILITETGNEILTY